MDIDIYPDIYKRLSKANYNANYIVKAGRVWMNNGLFERLLSGNHFMVLSTQLLRPF